MAPPGVELQRPGARVVALIKLLVVCDHKDCGIGAPAAAEAGRLLLGVKVNAMHSVEDAAAPKASLEPLGLDECFMLELAESRQAGLVRNELIGIGDD